MTLAEEIDALLPQTQCTRCGYDGCRPYSEAIANNDAPINQCPPGGSVTIAALAELLHRPRLPLNPENGVEGPALVAVIDEQRCIGCIKCLPPCPVDAIVGARKQTHTVIAALCTGCELCIAPCPVDCISMTPRSADSSEPTPDMNRGRYHSHNERKARRVEEQAALLAARKLRATGGIVTAGAGSAAEPGSGAEPGSTAGPDAAAGPGSAAAASGSAAGLGPAVALGSAAGLGSAATTRPKLTSETTT